MLQDEEIQQKYAEVNDILRRVDVVPLDEQVLLRAAKRLPVVLGTLDAIHLASAQMYRDFQAPSEPPIIFATHDHALAKAASAMQFQVIGV
jgi:predicted nucleic acid-binding protein